MPKKSAVSRFARPLHAYLTTLIAAGTEDVKTLARSIGMSQGHLADMKNQKKATTLDAIDLLAYYRSKSAIVTLQELLGEAKKLADREPGDFAEPPPKLPAEEELASARESVVEALSFSPTQLEDILAITGMPPHLLLVVLLELELAGRIERHAGARVSLKSTEENNESFSRRR